ncbi:MAG: hydroxyacylglutathione hydrolase [Alcanivorax sp.]|nr:hydroxyacylglutathione hydrolase [Alcanivorax sp.]
MLSSPTAIPAFRDNYIWALVEEDRCVVVDPGDAAPVEAFLDEHGLRLTAILVTHHHPDHIGGITALLNHHDACVYGPARETIPGCSRALVEDDHFSPEGLNLQLSVLEIPGHTLGHIAFYAAEEHWLFCGDTLFAGGCGRLFEGTPAQMYLSLHRLAALPDQTQVFCAHEYTQANLAFAAAVTPEDEAVHKRLQHVSVLRQEGRITLPTRIDLEKATNPFLRCSDTAIRHACEEHEPGSYQNPQQCFAALRRWKDNF